MDEDFEKIAVGLHPGYQQTLIERVRNDEIDPQVLETLLSYAKDFRPSPARTFARKVLCEGWRDDEGSHSA